MSQWGVLLINGMSSEQKGIYFKWEKLHKYSLWVECRENIGELTNRQVCPNQCDLVL